MARYERWPEILAEQIQAARGKPFAWGTQDCVTWTFAVVAAMTGVDHDAECRGTYSDRAGALERMAEIFGCGLEDAVTSRLGEPLPTPLFAQRGDVVSIATNDGPALGICLGADLVFVSPDGLTLRPITEAVKAWRI